MERKNGLRVLFIPIARFLLLHWDILHNQRMKRRSSRQSVCCWNSRLKYLRHQVHVPLDKLLNLCFHETWSWFACLLLCFQALPKVPVPPLEQTMSEYLRAIKPIVPSHQYEKTEKIVRKFSEQPGPRLYQYLVDKREAEDNWVSLTVEGFLEILTRNISGEIYLWIRKEIS